MIEQLLFETNTKPTIKASIKNENFLLSLLKETKEPKELLKSLNIKIADLEEIAKKLPKDKQEELKNILKDLKLSDNENTLNLKQNTFVLNPLFHYQTSEKHIQNKNIKVSEKNEQKTVEVIKKEITAKIKSKEIILSKAKINEFKQIKTLKELINFSNKNGLNIQKIIYSKEMENKINIIQKPIKEPLPKIIINNEIKNQPHNKPKSIIQSFISKTAKTDTPSIKHTIQTVQKKSIKHTDINQLKNENNLQNTISKENLSKFQENTDNITIKLEDLIKETKNEKKESETIHHQPELNSSTQIITQLKQNITKAKQSLKHFAENLKEAIQEYKPPIHKLSIELNPKELGKVELTLLHRGDNLQIQINSNQPSTINFFNTHQNELKNILVNMGYSEVNMSFNSNQQHQQQKQQYKQNQQTFSSQEEEGFIIEIPYKYA
jgi:hypothetical protein